MSFGQRLKMLRVQAGYSDADSFAKALGVARGTVYNWEAKEDPPMAKQLHRIAEVLEMEIEDVLRSRAWESNLVQESPGQYGAARFEYGPPPGEGPPPKRPPTATREELEAELAHYLDCAEASGALAFAAIQIRKFLDPGDFKHAATNKPKK